MYNVQRIVDCISGRIGFLSPRDIELQPIDPELLISKSGIYWEDGHPLVTVENMEDIRPESIPENFPAHNQASTYPVNATVIEGGTLYRSVKAVPAGILITDLVYWAVTSSFSIWARQKVQASIKKLVSSLIRGKKLNGNTKTLLEDAQLYQNAGNYADKELKQGRFVGMQIVFKRYQSLQATINKISTQFSEAATGPLKIYLYHTSSNEPLAEYEVTPDKKLSVQWHDLQEAVLRTGASYDTGGAFFIGYYEDDLELGVQAINLTNFNFRTGPCSTCGGYYDDSFKNWYKYISVLPVAIPASFINADRTIFNWDAATYYEETKTFGLNLHLTVGCDITNIICRQSALFDDALLQQFAVDILTEIAHSTRTNRIQERTKQTAMFALDDRPDNGEKGLVTKLEKAIMALDFDFSDIDGVCMPCSKTSGINYTSI